MTLSVETDILGIIALCLTIILAKKNFVRSHKKNKLFIAAAITTSILLILEIATIFMSNSDSKEWILWYRVANIIGFSLSPVVPFLILYFNMKKKDRGVYTRVLPTLLYINAFFCLLSYKTGWIFFVDEENQYSRGNFFLLPLSITMIYFALMVLEMKRANEEYEIEDKPLFSFILCLPLVGIVLQILFEELLLIWSLTSVSLLFYYIILRELQFKYDVQTGIRNRSAFEKEMEKHSNHNKDAGIVVLDINNLKSNNDQHGHKAGDETIYRAAKIIKESFQGVGKTYRIGGDEFCAICTETSKEAIDEALIALDCLLLRANENRLIKIILAYGYAFYTQNEGDDIYSVFSQADKAMYAHKAKLKGFSKKTK